MDIGYQKFTNPSWEPNMAVEDHIVAHDQINPFDAIWPNCSPQAHQNPSSSLTQLLASNLLGNQTGSLKAQEDEEEPEEELGAMKEMMFKIAAMQPVDIDPATIRKPKRRNVRISNDPQSIAARHRRERISEKMRILQRLVPGGTKMDTASMLDEAIRYVKFLKRHIRELQANHEPPPIRAAATGSVEGWVAAATTRPLGSPATPNSVAGTSYTYNEEGGGDPISSIYKVIGG